MNDYQHKSLSIDEVSLLTDWQVLTGEPIDVTRIKLSDPEQRNGFLEEVAHELIYKKGTVESLLEVLLKVTQADREEKCETGKKRTFEDIQKASAALFSYDAVVEEHIKKYIPLMLEDVKKMAETYNITPERILEVLSIITTENDTGLIPFPFTKESFPEIKKKIDELEIISAGFTFQNILQKLKEANHLDQGTPQKENK